MLTLRGLVGPAAARAFGAFVAAWVVVAVAVAPEHEASVRVGQAAAVSSAGRAAPSVVLWALALVAQASSPPETSLALAAALRQLQVRSAD